MEMRAKFGTSNTAAAASPRPANTATTPIRSRGAVASIEERVRRDIEHAQKIVEKRADEVGVRRDLTGAGISSKHDDIDNLRTLRSTETNLNSVMKTPTRSRSLSVVDAAAAAAAVTEESQDVPVRDTSSQLTKESDKLKLMVSEVYARHQSDLEAIRNANLGIDIPPTVAQSSRRKQQQEQQALLDAFSAKRSGSVSLQQQQQQQQQQQSGKVRPSPPPRPQPPVAVPRADATVVESGDDGGVGGRGRRSPHKLHMADPSSDDGGGGAAADPFNFMATARRTIHAATSMHLAQVHRQQPPSPSVASETSQHHSAVLSEGPLSTSRVSSTNVDGEVVGGHGEGGAVHADFVCADGATGAVKKALGGKSKRGKRRASASTSSRGKEASRGPNNEQKSVRVRLDRNSGKCRQSRFSRL